MPKSHVGIACQICPVCQNTHSEAILLDRKLKKRFEHGEKYSQGYELCPEHGDMAFDCLALVEIEEPDGELVEPTGKFIHIRRSLAKRHLAVPVEDATTHVYISQEAMALLICQATEATVH
jgi:hypothetical protein